MLTWGTSLSLILRPIIGLSNTGGRNLEFLLDSGKNYIGMGDYKVWDSSFQFYQTGRQLRWKLYNIFTGIENSEAKKDYIEQFDYIILPKNENLLNDQIREN